ncbi:MAG: DUF1553 domain-containing protein [Planctomycetes bacterium]|nr:DUF1553 domain-containing protein [Planctomycetota bacterium]
MSRRASVATVVLQCSVVAFVVPIAGADPSIVDEFDRLVAPLLERRCLSCHSTAARKGGLSLATLGEAQRGGKSGVAAIVAGAPEESALLAAVEARATADGARKARMPKAGEPLAADEVAALRLWIADGASWPEDRRLVDRSAAAEFEQRCDWWSLKPLAPIEPPRVDSLPQFAPAQLARGVEPLRNELDAFVRAQLADARLALAPLADPRTLIRRLTWDLTGLPPTPEEVANFLDESTNQDLIADDAAASAAAARAYERLVDRLLASPRHGERFARHWLDLVHFGETHGYDKDKPRAQAWPYRDWVIESLNNDLPYADFVARQLAADVVAPDEPAAVRALGFLAAGPWDYVGHVELREGTLDKEITRLLDRDDVVTNVMSTFASTTVHCARCHDHKFDAIAQRDYYALQAVFAGVERANRAYDDDPSVARRRAELQAELVALDGAAGHGATSEQLAASRNALGWHGEIAAAADTTQWVQLDLGETRAIDEVVLVPAHEVYGGWLGPGFGFPVRFRVEAADTVDFAVPRLLLDATAADVANPGDTPLVVEARGSALRFVRITATKLWKRTDDFAFALGEVACFTGGAGEQEGASFSVGASVTASSSIEAPPRWAAVNLADGSTSHGAIGSAIAWRERIAERARLEALLVALPPQRLVYAATSRFTPEGTFAPTPTPRSIHVLARGDVSTPIDPHTPVEPGALHCIAAPPPTFELDAAAPESARRAALASWLTDSRHPLAWRSIVNRAWQWHFGRGLVDTANDFGHMGGLPSHPELLDWLAGWFVAHGGSQKALHRLIVTSATYRQSSQGDPAALAADSGNRLLARMARIRLDAEQLRDGLLAMAGRLDLTMGGPSQQHFAFKDDHSPIYDYTKFDVDDAAARRRAIYRFAVRSVPDPWLDSLDCPDASLLTPKRNVTITALQALALLNDPFVIRQCEQLAARLVAERPGDAAAQVERLYELALARPPTAGESRALVEHAAAHGLAAACRVVVNLDEFVFVD